ncbi:MAG: glycosyltransferase family 2 protein [Oscillospiraceae bacterium]|nr:glycosyltransferase family 2 protein [Oscillospiraceae bacterium]
MARFAFLTEVRDCEKYLPQAIESILGQTWQDLDYYITDDGSQDGTREIIKAYAAKDPRIIPDFCTGDMHGNFNKTLKRIYESGAEYFALLDADDWYEPDFAQTMVELLEHTGADLAEGKFTAHYEEDGSQEELVGFGEGLLTLEEFTEDFAWYSFFDSVQQWWCKVYRLSLLRQLDLFADAGWDTEFVLRYRAGCEKFAVCDRAFHHYRIRQDSDCHKRLQTFDGRHAAKALALQHEAREKLLAAGNCRNQESRLMAAYQDVNGVRCNMMRLYAGDVPEAQAARELLYLLRLPFLPEAYESIQTAFEKTGRLFFAQPEQSRQAISSIQSYYGRFLRQIWKLEGQGQEKFLFEWLCRVFPNLALFFELEDLPILMVEKAVPILEGRWRGAIAGLRQALPQEPEGLLRAYVCGLIHPRDPFIPRFLEARQGTLSKKKQKFLDCKRETGLL